MRKLSTIQKRENLNYIAALDEPGNGGANHIYAIYGNPDKPVQNGTEVHEFIHFQNGGRGEKGAVNGVTDSDLLEIVRDRLKAFQSGPFLSRENARALTHIEEALMWLNRRVEDRIERDVLGTNQR